MARIDGYLPVEDYAAIGDSRSIAMVGRDGAIDWMCLPELDSPSIFAAILDPARGGNFVLQPDVPFSSERRYIERTNVLETSFHTDRGSVIVTDALTIDSSQAVPWRELVRKVEGVAGEVPMRWRIEPRFEYGRRAPDLHRFDGVEVIRGDHVQIALRTWQAGQSRVSDGAFEADVRIAEGEQAMLVMAATDDEPLPVPERDEVERRLQETIDVWRTWVARHTYEGPWQEAVERSLLAIRLLADGRTGAIAAAGTTSLPEVIGGERNYDYRFGWVRDLCFTLDALLAVGMRELPQASLTWLLNATSHTHPRINPVYALNGSVVRGQEALPLTGYRNSGPVHLGNNAGSQLQLGGWGDLIETVSSYVDHHHLLNPPSGERLADMGDLLARIWRCDDAGLWELGDRAQYGTSKLSIWVAFDRLLGLSEKGHVPARHPALWRRARDEVRRFIENQLFSEHKNSYLFKAGSDGLDCGMLLAARRRFGDVRGPRINGTIDAIRSELGAGGPLLYRYSGMREEENAFLACSFWMVEALAIAGREEEAAERMESMLALANDVGLYSEEMDPADRAMRGNFPQALTHLSVINAADAISRASERGHTRSQSGGVEAV